MGQLKKGLGKVSGKGKIGGKGKVKGKIVGALIKKGGWMGG